DGGLPRSCGGGVLSVGQWIAWLVDHGRNARRRRTTDCRISITVIDSRKEPEDALPCGVGQHNGIDNFLLRSVLRIEHAEEKCLVPDDWSAKTGGVLRAVVPQGCDMLPVVRPRVGIQNGIADVERGASVELVGSRSRSHLNLC